MIGQIECSIYNNWFSIRNNLSLLRESEAHPHIADERAELFLSHSFAETEIEYLDFLYSIVRISKPLNALETGTHCGLSAIAIAAGMRENIRMGHSPKLHTIEIDPHLSSCAKAMFARLGLHNIIQSHTMNSQDYVSGNNMDTQFDLVYFDSSRPTRIKEFDLLYRNHLLTPSCLLIFHDTSTMRPLSIPGEINKHSEYLLDLQKVETICEQRIDFTLSRGLSVFRL